MTSIKNTSKKKINSTLELILSWKENSLSGIKTNKVSEHLKIYNKNI